MFRNLADACGRQDRLSQTLHRYFRVKVLQVTHALHGRDERRHNFLLQEAVNVQVSKERVHQDFIHVVILTKSLTTVLD